MRKPITMRFDPVLLAGAKLRGSWENRSQTNVAESVVRARVADVMLTIDIADTATAEAFSRFGPIESRLS